VAERVLIAADTLPRAILELICFLFSQAAISFTRERVHQEPSAYADAPVNAPDREFDAGFEQRLVPCHNMLVNAIDQGSIEIKQRSRCVLPVLFRLLPL